MSTPSTPDWLSADQGRLNLGVDLTTGNAVTVNAEENCLIAGAKASGKSNALRVLAAPVLARGGEVVILTGDEVEADTWSAVCEVAVSPRQMADAIDRQYEVMEQRLKEARNEGLTIWQGGQRVFVVDEGVYLLARLKDDDERITRLYRFGSLGRAMRMPLWWSTGNPLSSGPFRGITGKVGSTLNTRIALRTTSRHQSQAILGGTPWSAAPHEIKHSEQGQGYLRYYSNRIQLWHADDDTFRSLRANPQP